MFSGLTASALSMPPSFSVIQWSPAPSCWLLHFETDCYALLALHLVPASRSLQKAYSENIPLVVSNLHLDPPIIYHPIIYHILCNAEGLSHRQLRTGASLSHSVHPRHADLCSLLRKGRTELEARVAEAVSLKCHNIMVWITVLTLSPEWRHMRGVWKQHLHHKWLNKWLLLTCTAGLWFPNTKRRGRVLPPVGIKTPAGQNMLISLYPLDLHKMR